MRALTDDLHRFWPAPVSDVDNAWEVLYDRIAAFKVDFDRFANPIGLFRHPQKAALVLPPSAPRPTNPLRSNGVTLDVRAGVLVAGRPIGSPDFVRAARGDRLRSSLARVDDILTLADHEPQLASKLLASCGNNLLDYHVGIMPLSDSDLIVHHFDAAIIAAQLRILRPAASTPNACSGPRLGAAVTLLSLPIGKGGFGLTPLAFKAPAAVVRSIIALVNEPALSDRSALAPTATAAHRRVCELVGVPVITADHPLSPSSLLTPPT